jgi:hypothetical protein
MGHHLSRAMKGVNEGFAAVQRAKEGKICFSKEKKQDF